MLDNTSLISSFVNKKPSRQKIIFCQGRIIFRGATLVHDTIVLLVDAITSMTTDVSLTSKNTRLTLFTLPSVVHLIGCVLLDSTIQALYKCTIYFYLHFIGFLGYMIYRYFSTFNKIS